DGIVLGDLDPQTQARAVAHRKEVHDDLEPFGVDAVGQVPRRFVGGVVDGRHVDAHVEAVLVAQLHDDVGQAFAWHVQHRLAARLTRRQFEPRHVHHRASAGAAPPGPLAVRLAGARSTGTLNSLRSFTAY